MLGMLAVTLFSACRKDKDDFAYEDEYNKSYKAWLAFKASAGDSYSYVLSRERSNVSKEELRLTTTVVNGKVTKRAFARIKIAQSGNEVLEEWTEEGATLGSHEAPFLFGLLTMDQFYGHVRMEILKLNSDFEYDFKAENNGMISYVSVKSKTLICIDDCYSGYYVKDIQKL